MAWAGTSSWEPPPRIELGTYALRVGFWLPDLLTWYVVDLLRPSVDVRSRPGGWLLVWLLSEHVALRPRSVWVRLPWPSRCRVRSIERTDAVEDRLIPINALLGLLLPNDVNVPSLARAGFRLAGLEVPVTAAPGASVIIDAVLVHVDTNHLVAVESKSGPNVEPDQAEKYGQLSASAVVQAAYVSLSVRVRPTIETVYLCLAAHSDRIRLGLATLGLTYPLIAASEASVVLDLAQSASPQLQAAFPANKIELAGPPPRLIQFDQDSEIDVIKPRVLAELVAAMTHRTPQISLASLSERATPHYPLYGRAAQGKLRRKVAEVRARSPPRCPTPSTLSVPLVTVTGSSAFCVLRRRTMRGDERRHTRHSRGQVEHAAAPGR